MLDVTRLILPFKSKRREEVDEDRSEIKRKDRNYAWF